MIELQFDGAIATATLDRAPVNAMNEAWITRLGEVLDAVEAREGTAVLRIRSAQRVFSAGADLALMRERFERDPGGGAMVEYARDLQRLFARLESLPVVTLAQIGGAAMGGGFELALACDLRVAADGAKLGLPEARLGLLPGAGGTQRLTRLCGDALSRRLILGAEIVDGTRAEALGLVHWVTPAASLEATTLEIATRVAALPSDALAACKRCIEAALDPARDGYAEELRGTAALYASPRTQALVRAFLEGGPGRSR